MDLSKLNAKDKADLKKQITKLVKDTIKEMDRKELDSKVSKIEQDNTRVLKNAEESFKDPENVVKYLKEVVEDFSYEIIKEENGISRKIESDQEDVEVKLKKKTLVHEFEAEAYALWKKPEIKTICRELEDLLKQSEAKLQECYQRYIDQNE